jgi:YggT family protein
MAQATEPLSVDRIENTEHVVQSGAGIEQRERVVTDGSGMAHRETSVRDVAGEQRQRLFKAAQLIWLVVGAVEVLIGLRGLLKLIGANPDNGFASFVYNFAGLFLAPFLSLTGSPSSGGMVLEVPSIIAMLLYALLGWAIIGVVLPLFERNTTRSTSTYDRYHG